MYIKAKNSKTLKSKKFKKNTKKSNALFFKFDLLYLFFLIVKI